MPKDGFFEDLADSALPEDEFTPDMGSKFLLDGYDFDGDYNQGVLDGARLPEVSGLSGLPDGFLRPEDDEDDPRLALSEEVFVPSNEEGMDLAEMMKEGSFPRLDWLDPTQLPDLERLPENPVDLGIPELEEAWGDGVSTTGLELVPNRDKELIDMAHGVQNRGPESGLPNDVPKKEARALHMSRLRKVARQAMRLSTFGAPLKKVLSYTELELGDDAPPIMRALSDDHGLAGNVFVRETAFPGMHNGKWDKELQRRASRAKYILAAPGSKMSAFDNYLGKEVVSEVPWEQAYAHYQPRLQALGIRVAGGTNPRDALRRAFQTRPTKRKARSGHKPIDQRPSERISLDDAWRELQANAPGAPPPVTKLKNERLWQAVHTRLAKWVGAGMLSEEDSLSLLQNPSSPRGVLKAAAKLVASKRTPRVYQGTGVGLGTPQEVDSLEEAWEHLRAAKDTSQDQVTEALRKKVLGSIHGMVRRGLLTAAEAKKIVSLGRSPMDTLKLASVVARTPRKQPIPESEAREFKGPIIGQVPLTAKAAKKDTTEHDRILLAAKESGIRAVEIRQMLHVARKNMNEGFAGNDLTQLLRVKFSKPLREAGSELLSELRSKHEGLAGHLYVDAEAYASARGVTGCEEGARRHRTTPIKHLLAMKRCSSCTHNSEAFCTKYKKAIALKPPVKDPAAYQKEMLRLADGSDAERTAALFQPSNIYDPGEFDLQPERDISFDEGPSTEQLSEVLFGGMRID